MITIKKIEGRADFIARRAAANQLAKQLFGCAICRESSGKPYLENRSAYISISHTDCYLALIWEPKTAVAIDIELIDRQVDNLCSRFASPKEMEICHSVFPRNEALLVWCAKETLYKLSSRDGVNLLDDLQIVAAAGNRLTGICWDQKIELEWRVDDKLLIVYTL